MGFPTTAHPVWKRKQPPVRRATPVNVAVDRIGPDLISGPVFDPRFYYCLFAGIVSHESRQEYPHHALQRTAVSVFIRFHAFCRAGLRRALFA